MGLKSKLVSGFEDLLLVRLEKSWSLEKLKDPLILPVKPGKLQRDNSDVLPVEPGELRTG